MLIEAASRCPDGVRRLRCHQEIRVDVSSVEVFEGDQVEWSDSSPRKGRRARRAGENFQFLRAAPARIIYQHSYIKNLDTSVIGQSRDVSFSAKLV